MTKEQLDVRNSMLETMCGMSDRVLDIKANIRLKALIGRNDDKVKDDLLSILDDCVFYSWCSDMMIGTLDYLWRMSGGTQEELDTRIAS